MFPDTTAQGVFLVLHVLSAMVAFGPQFAYQTLMRAGSTREVARLHTYVTLPSLVLVWVFGMGLVGMSENRVEMSDTWIVLSLIAWTVALAAGWFLVRPALAGDGPDVRQKLAMGAGITHLMLVVLLWLMIFKPFVERGS